MPVTQVLVTYTDCTPAKLASVQTVLAAHPDVFTTLVDAYDGPIADYTPNVTLNVSDGDTPWSAAKNTGFKALLDELSA